MHARLTIVEHRANAQHLTWVQFQQKAAEIDALVKGTFSKERVFQLGLTLPWWHFSGILLTVKIAFILHNLYGLMFPPYYYIPYAANIKQESGKLFHYFFIPKM